MGKTGGKGVGEVVWGLDYLSIGNLSLAALIYVFTLGEVNQSPL